MKYEAGSGIATVDNESKDRGHKVIDHDDRECRDIKSVDGFKDDENSCG